MEAKRMKASSMVAPNGGEEENFDLWRLRTVAERMTTFDLQRLRTAANCSGTSHFSSVFFNPWQAFFKREFYRNWPFLIGFAVTGAIITKMTYGLTGGLQIRCWRTILFAWLYHLEQHRVAIIGAILAATERRNI